MKTGLIVVGVIVVVIIVAYIAARAWFGKFPF